MLHFKATADYTTSDETVQGEVIGTRFQGEGEEADGATITLYNQETSVLSAYVFAGAADNQGLAYWNNTLDRWMILMPECEEAAAQGDWTPV